MFIQCRFIPYLHWHDQMLTCPPRSRMLTPTTLEMQVARRARPPMSRPPAQPVDRMRGRSAALTGSAAATLVRSLPLGRLLLPCPVFTLASVARFTLSCYQVQVNHGLLQFMHRSTWSLLALTT